MYISFIFIYVFFFFFAFLYEWTGRPRPSSSQPNAHTIAMQQYKGFNFLFFFFLVYIVKNCVQNTISLSRSEWAQGVISYLCPNSLLALFDAQIDWELRQGVKNEYNLGRLVIRLLVRNSLPFGKSGSLVFGRRNMDTKTSQSRHV